MLIEFQRPTFRSGYVENGAPAASHVGLLVNALSLAHSACPVAETGIARHAQTPLDIEKNARLTGAIGDIPTQAAAPRAAEENSHWARSTKNFTNVAVRSIGENVATVAVRYVATKGAAAMLGNIGVVSRYVVAGGIPVATVLCGAAIMAKDIYQGDAKLNSMETFAKCFLGAATVGSVAVAAAIGVLPAVASLVAVNYVVDGVRQCIRDKYVLTTDGPSESNGALIASGLMSGVAGAAGEAIKHGIGAARLGALAPGVVADLSRMATDVAIDTTSTIGKFFCGESLNHYFADPAKVADPVSLSGGSGNRINVALQKKENIQLNKSLLTAFACTATEDCTKATLATIAGTIAGAAAPGWKKSAAIAARAIAETVLYPVAARAKGGSGGDNYRLDGESEPAAAHMKNARDPVISPGTVKPA